MAYHFRQPKTPENSSIGEPWLPRKLAMTSVEASAIFGLIQLLIRVQESECWVPTLQKAKSQVTRDQTDAVDLELWSAWLQALSGRAAFGDPEGDPYLECQKLICSKLDWEQWKEKPKSVSASWPKALERQKAKEGNESFWLKNG